MRIFGILVVVGVVGLSLSALATDESTDEAASASGVECTLYTKPYTATEHGAFALPGGVQWKVMPRYVGIGEDGERIVDDRLTLVLVDAENSFWPVIAKMSVEEAEQLHRDLTTVIAQNKGGPDQSR